MLRSVKCWDIRQIVPLKVSRLCPFVLLIRVTWWRWLSSTGVVVVMIRKNQNNAETRPSATPSTEYLTWVGPGSNPGLPRDRLATGPWHGMLFAVSYCWRNTKHTMASRNLHRTLANVYDGRGCSSDVQELRWSFGRGSKSHSQYFVITRVADKSLARPGRKQATATKLGIYSTYTPRSSIHFLARCCTFCKPLKKKSEGCPFNQVSAAAMTSTSDEK